MMTAPHCSTPACQRCLIIRMTARTAVFARVALGLISGLVAVSAQQSQTDAIETASFEVASVKLNNSGSQSSGTNWQSSGRLIATNVTLKAVIANAYEVRTFQIEGPGWLDADRFDISARAPEGAPDRLRPAMLRTLLATRFGLVAHFETRERPRYALVTLRSDGRLGPQLKKSQLVCSGGSAPPEGGAFCGLSTSVGNTGGRIIGGGLPMDRVAAALANFAVDQTVLNRTGLDGVFDFELQFSRLPSNERPDVPSIFTAVQEQLGLKLETARGPVQFLMIDKVEQPTPD
jgi:uncharacterized protein (TIGR03435 family)